MKDNTPDYTSYSLDDLYDVRRRINREKYPDRYERLTSEITRREQLSENIVLKQEQKKTAHVQKAEWLGKLLIFFSAITAFFWVIAPTMLVIRSSSWITTPCVIVHTPVENQSYFKVTYRYTFRGITYDGERMSPIPNSHRDRWYPNARKRRKRDSYDRLTNGRQTYCFVNSNNPEESVLRRDTGSSLYFNIAFTFLLLYIGLATLREPEKVRFKGFGSN